jgi:hypothetical protein
VELGPGGNVHVGKESLPRPLHPGLVHVHHLGLVGVGHVRFIACHPINIKRETCTQSKVFLRLQFIQCSTCIICTLFDDNFEIVFCVLKIHLAPCQSGNFSYVLILSYYPTNLFPSAPSSQPPSKNIKRSLEERQNVVFLECYPITSLGGSKTND